jgi:hypothetical protein
MKFMLMMNCPRDGYEQFGKWPQGLLEKHMAFVHDFNRKLSAAGEMVSCEGLAAPTQAKLVRAGKDGKPVTDGVFPESKEYLAGYWIVDVDSPERAYQVAADAAQAPTPGGFVMSIEVREVMSGPPKDIG